MILNRGTSNVPRLATSTSKFSTRNDEDSHRDNSTHLFPMEEKKKTHRLRFINLVQSCPILNSANDIEAKSHKRNDKYSNYYYCRFGKPFVCYRWWLRLSHFFPQVIGCSTRIKTCFQPKIDNFSAKPKTSLKRLIEDNFAMCQCVKNAKA